MNVSSPHSKSIALIGTLNLVINPTNAGQCVVAIDRAVDLAGQFLNTLGMKNSRTLLCGRYDVQAGVDYDFRHARSVKLLAEGETDSITIPMAMIVEAQRQSLPAMDRSPIVERTDNSDAVVVLPGLVREQTFHVARLTRGLCVLVIDDTSIQHAGPGDWPSVLAEVDVVLLTESAARS